MLHYKIILVLNDLVLKVVVFSFPLLEYMEHNYHLILNHPYHHFFGISKKALLHFEVIAIILTLIAGPGCKDIFVYIYLFCFKHISYILYINLISLIFFFVESQEDT